MLMRYAYNQLCILNLSFTTQPLYFDRALHNYIQKTCNCTNFTVNTSLVNCIDDNSALYNIQLASPMAGSVILELWSDNEMYNPQGIDVGVATISICNTTCPTKDKGSSKSSSIRAPVYLIIFINLLLICIATYTDDVM